MKFFGKSFFIVFLLLFSSFIQGQISNNDPHLMVLDIEDKNNAPLFFALARQCFNGNFKCRDPIKEGLKLLEWSAHLGYAPAQHYLGSIYDLGERGVKKDLKKAYKHYIEAARQDYAYSQNALANYYLHRAEADGGPDFKKGLSWLKRAIENELAIAQANMASIYLFGRYGVQKNEKKAIELLEKAAVQKHRWAQAELGRRYLYGQGVNQDYNMAFFHLVQAAWHNNPMGQFYLAELFFNGWGVDKDEKSSSFWLEKLNKNSSPEAISFRKNIIQFMNQVDKKHSKKENNCAKFF